MTVKVNNAGTTFVRVRLYGVGVDAWDAFGPDSSLYEDHNTAKHKKDTTYGTDVYAVLLDIPINSINKIVDSKSKVPA